MQVNPRASIQTYSAAPVAQSRSLEYVASFRTPRAEVFTLPNGHKGLKNFRIFKVGTFKDSMGFERTWESIHLDQMVAHYSLLKDGGFFVDVPVREDHFMSMRSVVGYFQDVYRDPEDASFLAATIEFTEPDAFDKWERGTWRGRSLEVGEYETNSGALFWPVVMGVAFVDIPAVEGLYEAGKRNNRSVYVIQDDKEMPVSVGQGQSGQGGTPPAPPAQTQATPPSPPPPPSQPINVVLQTSPANSNDSGQHAAPAPAALQAATSPTPPQAFRVNGQDTTDFAAVQRHIDTLETAAREATQVNRAEFVNRLAQNNIILASQIESMTAHAQSLTPEQFETFRVTFEGQPGSPLLGTHGAQEGSQPQSPPQAGQFASNASSDAPLKDLELDKQIVAQHRRAGMPKDKIEKTPSYQRLQAANAAGQR